MTFPAKKIASVENIAIFSFALPNYVLRGPFSGNHTVTHNAFYSSMTVITQTNITSAMSGAGVSFSSSSASFTDFRSFVYMFWMFLFIVSDDFFGSLDNFVYPICQIIFV